jgi:hypothetical protein
MRPSTLQRITSGKLRRGGAPRKPRDFVKAGVTIYDGCGNEIVGYRTSTNFKKRKAG